MNWRKLFGGQNAKETNTKNGSELFDEIPPHVSGGDGSSPETAVIIQSVRDEYKYMMHRFPGYMLSTQGLIMSDGGKHYDRMTWQKQGEEVTIYFDISSFYGKLPGD